MSTSIIALLGLIALLALFALRMPVGFAMALVGIIGFGLVAGWLPGLKLMARDFYAIFSHYSLSVVPMFVLMGSIAFSSGISKRLFDTAAKWLGRLPGGLGIATVVACAGFGAVCGSTIAAAAAMGKATLPEMKRYGYDDALRTGCVASAGSLAIMIPPSTAMIIYGILTEQSIGKLFIAGILPGLFLTVLFMITVLLLVWRKPEIAPRGPKFSWQAKVRSLAGTVETIVLFILVLGGLFAGVFTPTEAGAVGAFGALLIAVLRRQINGKALWEGITETTRITAMVFTIVAGATIFGHFMGIAGVPMAFADWLSGLPLPRAIVMIFILLMYVLGGCFMDSLPLIVLTIPIIFPTVVKLGYDPIWFGVMHVLVAEMGVITPPVGVNVYVIKSVAPEVPLQTIFKGIAPFVASIIIAVTGLMLVPQIALVLPNAMG